MFQILHRLPESSVLERTPVWCSGTPLCLMVDSQLLVKTFTFFGIPHYSSKARRSQRISDSQATCWRERRRRATGGWGSTSTRIPTPPTKQSGWLKEWRTKWGFMLSTVLACLVTVLPHSRLCQSVGFYWHEEKIHFVHINNELWWRPN